MSSNQSCKTQNLKANNYDGEVWGKKAFLICIIHYINKLHTWDDLFLMFRLQVFRLFITCWIFK